MEYKNKKKIAPIVIAAMVMVVIALAAFIMPASAQGNPGAGCPSETKFNGTMHGGIYFEQIGWYQNTPFTVTFNDVPAGKKIARVYTGIWGGSPSKGGEFNITVNGHTTDTYQACDPCTGEPCAGSQSLRCDALNWSGNSPPNVPTGDMRDYTVGCNVHFMSYNATQYINAGSNTITVDSACCDNCTCWYNQAYLIALLVVYENESMPNMTYWINEGAPYMEENSYCDGPDDHHEASFYFNGSHISSPKKVKYSVLGWPHVFNASEGAAYTKLNNNDIGSPDVSESYGSGYYEVFVRWNNISTESLDPNSNYMEYYDDAPFYERAFAAVLMVQGPVNNPDLIVTDIEFPRTGMRPGTVHTVKATIKNDGGVATPTSSNVSLSAGSYNEKKTIGSLDPDESATVSFTDVELTYGSYDFTVVADCDNDVDEVAFEDNNEETKKQQVGYVIVVESNSDFEELNVSGAAPLPAGCFENKSGTYYIQNMNNDPIENCAGRGIDIRNTNAHFVITNCTVRDCKSGHTGIHMHSVTNGKINNCVVANNTGKGIRMMNCSLIDIENNTVQNNTIYGIDVYLAIMPEPDCEDITIANNELIGNEYGVELLGDNCIVRDNIIRNSTVYGMYGFGNDSQIYNNTIEYSANYGIMMNYDTPAHPCLRNCIFGNTFIDNNLEYPEHTSQAYDSGDNYWNSTVKLGYYNDTCGAACAHDNYIGNNWSDYTGGDLDGDKIGDAWYAIDDITPVQHLPSENDTAPLMEPWVDYNRSIDCGDVNCDSNVDFGDVVAVRNHWFYGFPLSSSWAGDVNRDGNIDFGDVVAVRNHWFYGFSLNCCTGCEVF